MNTFYYCLLLLISVFISSVSQVLLKKSALHSYNSHIKEYLNPLVISAYVIFFGATILTVFSYRGIPLYLGPILETTGYLYITFFGVKLFGEQISRMKCVAIVMIIVGIVICAL